MKHSTRIALIYLAFSAVWIGVSDSTLEALFRERYLQISLYKGWAFVGITAMFLKIWLLAEERRRDDVEARLQTSAVTDPLTGLRNRIALIEHLDHAIARARRENRHIGLLYLDIDGFKAINDTHGHAEGDALLREFAARLSRGLRASEVAARLGGDEFVVLVDGGDDLAALSQRMMTSLREPYPIAGQPMPVTVSIGVAEFPRHGSNSDALLHAADAAMYSSKRTGRDRISVAALESQTPAGEGGRRLCADTPHQL